MLEKQIKRLGPPSRIGVIGGGQLGRMLTLEAKQMGYHVTVLDPKPDAPAGQVADAQIIASFEDARALRILAEGSDVLTYEFEHIDAHLLSELEDQGHRVYPSSATLKVIQNKFEQKSRLQSLGIPVPEFHKIDSLETLKTTFRQMGGRLVLKSCTGGYDGKGNRIVKSSDQLDDAYADFEGTEMMAEAFVDYIQEVSILVARNHESLVLYPIAENVHEDSILIKSIIPACLSEKAEAGIREIASKIVDALDDYGVFCIEFFVDAQQGVSVNEIAPRPHNSGHYSIEACVTSQFGQLLRVITGMPLGSARLKSPCVMFNLLGQGEGTGNYRLSGTESLLALEDAYLHVYGKPETGHLRKLGHVTVLGETAEAAEDKALRAFNQLEIEILGGNENDSTVLAG